MKNRFALVTVLVALFWTTLVFAQEATSQPVLEEPSAVGRLLDALIQIAGVALGVVALFLVRKGLALFEEKTGIEITNQVRYTTEDLADKAIAYAEEQVRKALKKKDEKLVLPDKLEAALDFFMDLAAKYEIVDLGKEQVKKLLEARLNQTRDQDLTATLKSSTL